MLGLHALGVARMPVASNQRANFRMVSPYDLMVFGLLLASSRRYSQDGSRRSSGAAAGIEGDDVAHEPLRFRTLGPGRTGGNHKV
jgi:hypothetical protein